MPVGDKSSSSGKTLDDHIKALKYTVFFLNTIKWLIGASVFALTIWLKFEPGIDDWVTKLELQPVYTGLYVLIVSSVIVMAVSFLGCGAALAESTVGLLAFAVAEILSFIIGLSGAAVLLDNSTYNSNLQPLIRKSMLRLIVHAGQDERLRETLQIVQENIGCCGADGPHDYIKLNQPFPTQCRDTVTGNAFFYGCVDELTWFFEEKTAWIVGLVMTLCFIHVINVALSAILYQAIKKEDEEKGFRG